MGDKVTFEVVTAAFALDADPALKRLGERVHFVDVGGVAVDEAPGLELVARGLQAQHCLCLMPFMPPCGPSHAPQSPAPQAPTLREAVVYWLKLGFISFGGPAGQIAIMREDLAVRKRWISERRYLHALIYCMVLPGPEAQQLATHMGWLMHRTWGGIVAGGLFVLPSLFMLIGLSWVYMAYGDVPAVAGVLYGIKPAVTAIVLVAGVAGHLGGRFMPDKSFFTFLPSSFSSFLVALSSNPPTAISNLPPRSQVLPPQWWALS